jgi:hypothetical protein
VLCKGPRRGRYFRDLQQASDGPGGLLHGKATEGTTDRKFV